MKYVIDTSAYSSFFRGDARLAKYFKGGVDIYVPTVVLGELRAGFSLGSKYEYNDGHLLRFLDKPHVSVINIGDKTTSIFGSVFAQLKRSGKPIGVNDIWIAALALEYSCTLVTLDSDFCRVKGLRTEPEIKN